jgi:hypothetical protein
VQEGRFAELVVKLSVTPTCAEELQELAAATAAAGVALVDMNHDIQAVEARASLLLLHISLKC